MRQLLQKYARILAAACVALVPLVASGVSKAATPAWYDPAWQYRKAITFNHTKVGDADAIRFPASINLDNDTDIAAHARTDHQDVIFTAADGVTRLNAEVTTPQTNNVVTNSGAWCWYQDPRAIHYSGTRNATYMGWVNNVGDIIIYQYDENAKTQSTYTLHGALNYDDHAAPAIVFRPDGRLMVFYSAHGGGTMYYRVSTNPEDISAWGAEQTMPTNTSGMNSGFTYSHPVILKGENNKLYDFWRGGNYQPTYSSSTDLGATWAPAQTLFTANNTQRPYLKVVSDDQNRIDFVATDGNPNETTTSVYYFSYHNGAFYKADGTFIKNMDGTPLTPAMVDTVYSAAAHGNVSGWNWDIAIDSTGNPVIVYATLPASNDHRYHYARWNGTSWTDTEMTQAGGTIGGGLEPNYSPGITLDHDDPSIVYLAKQVGSYDEIQKWTTADGGVTWTSSSLTTGSTQNNVRPIVPRHHDANMQVLWMYGYYPFWNSFQTGIKTYPALQGTGQTTSEAYVQIPDLSNTTDTTVYMYYGNPNAPAQTTGRATWGTTYGLVEHMTDVAGVQNKLFESSSYNNTGVKVGSNESMETLGMAGKAQYFDGTTDAAAESVASNMANTAGFTYEAWVKFQKAAGTRTTPYVIASNLSATASNAGFQLQVNPTTSALEAYANTSLNGGTKIGGSFPDLVLDGNWHHVAITYDTFYGLRGYLDAKVSTTRFPSTVNLAAGVSPMLYTGNTGSGASNGFRGWMDELRYSAGIKRTPAWLNAEVVNWFTPSQFYTESAAQTNN